jgi:tRNA(Ile)-lysidine synthase
MQITVGAGTYVVAVSGGVDSVVMLDLLRKHPGIKLIVAHFDHGIRDDSAKDRKLVQDIAKRHGLPFVHQAGRLGPGTSEAAARTARYKFLQSVMEASKAKAIVTAHHQDDLLETAILNLLRGSGRKGLTSLKSRDGLVRPLLPYTKEQIRDYAVQHGLGWREDLTNDDLRFKRNYIRHKILPKFSLGQRAQLLILLEGLQAVNEELDMHINNLLHSQPALKKIDRHWFIQLPHDVAQEIVHTWLGRAGVRNLTRKTVDRLVVAMKTSHIGRRIDVDQKYILVVNKHHLALTYAER